MMLQVTYRAKVRYIRDVFACLSNSRILDNTEEVDMSVS